MCVPLRLGISLLDCIDTDLAKVNENIYRQDHDGCKRPCDK